MNAELIYNIFETSNKHNVDTTLAAEILRGREVIPDKQTKNELCEFIGLHFDPIYRAFGSENKKLFFDIIHVCEKSNNEEADMLLRAYATGNEKLIEEMESKYGNIE